ncbi:hypothetical protein J415_27520 [Klebsiella michiganensis HKOPL1]|nr:hypothetical protein J415_27520 [Klebsiella michiganensis HKOPL1]
MLLLIIKLALGCDIAHPPGMINIHLGKIITMTIKLCIQLFFRRR